MKVSQYLQNTIGNEDARKFQKRIPIIREYQDDFYAWLKWQRHVPVINDIENKTVHVRGNPFSVQSIVSKLKMFPNY
jgi:hypothetical protein